jgi:hypothetical protein
VSDELLETSRRLISLGPRTLGQDVALVRSPIWHLVSRTLTSDELVSPSGPLVRVAGPSLTIGDQRLFAELFTRWARAGFPSDHRVSFTIADLAHALGLERGGKQYAIVRASLRRLTGAVFADVQPDGRYESETGGALLASYHTRSRPGTPSSAVFNERSARTLLRHPMTYLDAPTWDAIMARDALAARLWVWLEGERIREEWRWSLFPDSRAPVVLGLQPPTRRTTPVAHLLTIQSWSRRRKIVERIRTAARTVVDVDRRYDLEVRPSVSDTGNYVLVCRRAAKPSRADPDRDASADATAAWHSISPRRRLSHKQMSVLRDLIAEWGATRIVDALTAAAGSSDPFARLLHAVAAWRDSQEADWRAAKAKEEDDAAATLRAIHARLAEPAGTPSTPSPERSGNGPSSLRTLLSDLG